jgi:acetylornithine deacetylase/succinyl-diaminopimelate desuccinylase-like protein
MIDLIEKLVAIPSHNDERKISDFLYQEIKKYAKNHKIILQKYSNNGRNLLVLSRNPKLLIDVHLDTIPPGELLNWKDNPYKILKNNNQLIGLGVCDVKCNLAICLKLLKEIDCDQVSFSFCGGEETLSLGLKKALLSNLLKQIPFAIVMEPTNLNICIGHKGQVGAEIFFSGESSHGSIPKFNKNAIIKAYNFISVLVEEFERWKKEDKLFGENSFNIGIVQGGEAMNKVAEKCKLSIDFRTLPGQNKEDIHNFILEIGKISKTKFRTNIKFFPPAWYNNGRMPIEDLLMALKRKRTQIDIYPFWSHAGLLSQKGIPSIIFGPGDIKYAHQANEHIDYKQIDEAFNILLNFIKNI